MEIRLGGQGYGTLYAVTDQNGSFAVSLLPGGTYNIGVKGDTTLCSVKSGIYLGPGETRVDFGILPAGDASGDNVVDIVDFSILRSLFGRMAHRADFNGDSIVDIMDFSLLRTNFGRRGDTVW